MTNTFIFDAHLHLFSRQVFAFYAKQVPELKGVADPAAAVIARLRVEPPPSEPEALAKLWIAELDRHQVERAVLFGSAPGEQESVARAVRAYPDRFVGFQMFNPRTPNAQAVLEDIVSKGLRGLLLFPALHEYFPDDAVCHSVYEAAQLRRFVVFVHIGFLKIVIREKLGITACLDERFGDPRRLARVLREFPDVPFIVPHFGSGFLGPLLAATQGVRNLYLDTSSSNSWMEKTPEYPTLKTVFRTVLDAKTFGPDRILFGSDSTDFPRGWRRDIYQAQREALDKLELSVGDEEAIFWGNLARLLR